MASQNDIIVDESKSYMDETTQREKQLASWVIDRVREWEEHRKSNYDTKWEEYYRLWRGIYKDSDKTRKSERSKLISPALQQAIESQVAEIEEATFGRKAWFDLDDDILDQEAQDMTILRDRLLEDYELDGLAAEVAKAYLNGALYGTGIAKVLVDRVEEFVVEPDPQLAQQGINRPITKKRSRIRVHWEAVTPKQFVIDPAARNIDEALGVAHVMERPIHTIRAKQRAGIYKDAPLGSFDGRETDVDILTNQSKERARIVEYYGLVPRDLLPVEKNDDEVVVDLSKDLDKNAATISIDEDDLVEAIVIIANDSVILKDIPNPYLMKDRPFVSFQTDTVPGKFWGRGIAEKGYNPQKALDAELRARIDAMALATHPMIAVDSTRLNTRGSNLSVGPGKIFLTNGDPSNALMPFNLGQVNQASFPQAGDLERMIQMGTGAMDSATPTSINPRNQTASGMSMMQAGFFKRSKRTLQNISRQFLIPLIKKTAWRQMQFNPQRYPIKDYKFKVVSSMGIMAREYEQAQLTQLLSIVPPDSPVFSVLIKGIFENSSLENKAELLEALVQANQPNPAQQQAQQEAQAMQKAMATAELKKTESEIVKNFADAQAKTDKVSVDRLQAQTNRISALAQAASKNKE